jgi:hypothetical protein
VYDVARTRIARKPATGAVQTAAAVAVVAAVVEPIGVARIAAKVCPSTLPSKATVHVPPPTI